MIYPYAYIIWFLFLVWTDNILEKAHIRGAQGEKMFSIIAFLYMGYMLVFVIFQTVNFSRSKESCGAAKINMIVKLVQIPAYIGHFIMGCIGTVMSIWGIGFIFVAIIVDALTIIHTGILAVGCMINMKRTNVLTTKMAVLAAIGSFVYCVDVVIAIVVFLVERNKKIYD